jgi:hypothetical protein
MAQPSKNRQPDRRGWGTGTVPEAAARGKTDYGRTTFTKPEKPTLTVTRVGGRPGGKISSS